MNAPAGQPGHERGLIALGALLVPLAYPPFHLLVPSFICLVPAVLLIVRTDGDPRPARRLAVSGFWFGTLANALVLYWLIVALWRFSKLSALAYIVTVTTLGLLTAALFVAVGWLRRTGVPVLAAFPLLWTALEWFVAHLPDVGFPWLGLGTSLTGFPTLVQLADVVGARGITLLLALANTTIALTWLRRARPLRAAAIAATVVAGTVAAAAYGLARERHIPLRRVGELALVQPNVGYAAKRNRSLQDSLVFALVDQSWAAARAGNPDLIVWPEAAVPDYFFRNPEWEAAISRHAARAGTPILVGGHDMVFETREKYEYYNSAFLFDATGRSDLQPVYHKHYLVPIVERVPFINPRWIDLTWFGGFGVGEPGPVYDVATGRFGVLICYESAFEDLSRDYRRRGAHFLVNITNDAWFGRTSAPYQHAAHLVMRAIENRVGIARAANSGISEFVDPLGRKSRTTELEIEATVIGPLATSDAVPVYTRWGDWVGYGTLILSAVLCLWAGARHYRSLAVLDRVGAERAAGRGREEKPPDRCRTEGRSMI